MRGIDAAAMYLPRYRLAAEEIEEAWGTAPRIESAAVPAADEDAFTMAVAAAETIFERTELKRRKIEHICVGTTTPPLEEGMFAPRLGRALGLGRAVEAAEHTQSTLAGAEALSHALDASGPALVAIADCPVGDPAEGQGAGAVAFLVTDDARVAVSDKAWHTDEYPGLRYRERGTERIEALGVTTYERNATRECVAGAVSKLTESDFHAAALHQPDARMPGRIARDLSLDSDAVERGTVVSHLGDAGAATVPIGLVRALAGADSDERTLAGFFGSGSAGAAFAFEGSLDVGGLDNVDIPEGERVSYSTYLRKRGILTTGAVSGGGARVSLPTWRRTLDQRY
ncbi:MAG TPA: 3-hydroxy-3-methylglutaryl CoA synthase, partial [Halococcus sp.]|nr:3-hydroxy-3-methylglutaryl CoA synthase [Halococcus sp.]